MARAAVPGRLAWRVAPLAEARRETETARTLVFDVPDWPGQTAGQHVDVRLTADDGCTAQRSYSLSAPDRVELAVQRIADGEVSPHLTDVIGVGDPVEIRAAEPDRSPRWQCTTARPAWSPAAPDAIMSCCASSAPRTRPGSTSAEWCGCA